MRIFKIYFLTSVLCFSIFNSTRGSCDDKSGDDKSGTDIPTSKVSPLPRVLQDGIEEAIRRIQTEPACKALFKRWEDPVALIERFLSAGGLRWGNLYPQEKTSKDNAEPTLYFKAFSDANTGAITTSAIVITIKKSQNLWVSLPVITVNTKGFLFTGKAKSGREVLELENTGFESLNSHTQMVAVGLIHEFLHAIWAIPKDGTDPHQSIGNNRTVTRGCYPKD